MPATWRWCARARPTSRSCWYRRHLRSRPRSTPDAAATPACICPSGSAASIFPPSRRSTCAPKARRAAASSRRGSPRRCRLALARGEQALLFLNRRGYAPLTLCRQCGFRLACPELRRLAGRSPLPPPAGLPPLRLLDAAAGAMPAMPGDRVVRRGRSRRRAAGAGGGGAVSRSRILVLSSDLVESVERLREELDDIAQGPVRHRDRHAARRQGPPLPEAQSGRRRRRRSRPCERRPARGRTHVPTAASGRRPRRPRGGPRHRLPADPSARASGDAGAGGRRSRRVLHKRDRRCARRRTIRRSAGSRAC